MQALHFTVEEMNIVAMYKADSLAATLTAIDEAMPEIYDEEIITIAESASRKLSTLTELAFLELTFPLADEDDGDSNEDGQEAPPQDAPQ